MIVHIVPRLFDRDNGIVGGAERYAYELARHMAEVVPTTLVTFGDREFSGFAGKAAVRVIGNPTYVRGQRSNPISISLLRELLAADVVHCHQHHVFASSLAALFCRATGRRVFVTDLGGGGWDISAYVSTDSWYHGHLHISEYSKGYYGHGSNPTAHVIFGGVDIEKFFPSNIQREKTVVFVGRIMPHKGIDDLVQAIPSDVNLEIIGQPYDARYLGDLHCLGGGKKVVFRHGCDDETLVEAYRRALCLVLPSVYRTSYGAETRVSELLGQTLLEGMACGTPVICTSVGAMPEIVEDGICGFVVPPNDPAALREKIGWLSDHPQERRRMGLMARRRVEAKFTWSTVVDRCLRIYSGERDRVEDAQRT